MSRSRTVNRPAIDDLLGSILSTWYESVAEWMPPGQLSADTCAECRSTALAFSFDMLAWPHELMHQLGASLDGAIAIITESLTDETDPVVLRRRDEHLATCPQPLDLCVRDYVIREISERKEELTDVLEQCVTPRIDEWVLAQPFTLTPRLRG